MARTRLRGISIGGVGIGIEVPDNFAWEWPEAPVAEFQCLPRDPEVHVGVRVGDPGRDDPRGERYAIGAWTFEVARRETDWELGLVYAGHRAVRAVFDREFLVGEVIVSEQTARSRSYPLPQPLDQWIVLHRTVAGGGLCLTADAVARDGQAILRLGTPDARSTNGSQRPATSLLGQNALLVRESRDHLRLYRTPWNEPFDAGLPYESRVQEIQCVDPNEVPYRIPLDSAEAADLLVRHAVVPLCDESLLDRVLCNAQRIAQRAGVVECGASCSVSDAPMAWCSPQLQGAFAPPDGNL